MSTKMNVPLRLRLALALAFSSACGNDPAGQPGLTAPPPDDLQTLTVRLVRSDPASSLTEGPSRVSAAADDNQAPLAVFKVRPAPNADGLIAGDTPFDVELNACRSVDPEGDRLLYTIDAEGDGTTEEAGTNGGNCRRTFTYTAEQGQVRELTPTICVVDLDAAGRPQRTPECRRYGLRVIGAPAPAPECALTKNGGWEGLPGLICRCSLTGQTLPFFSDFSSLCFASGFSTAGITVGVGCDCS